MIPGSLPFVSLGREESTKTSSIRRLSRGIQNPYNRLGRRESIHCVAYCVDA